MVLEDPLIGRQFAGAKIERLLGQGGMARVYLGRDLKLQRPVAIKIIADAYRGDPAYVERFEREAQTIASWNHPNIMQVYSAGEEAGFTFFVMEYIRGLDLQRIVEQYRQAGKRMPHGEVVRIARAVASALDYAHGRGVIHRDVKPSNIIIADDGRVVLADFGIALNTSGGTLGQVFGSPHYISPEQARSSAKAVPQSDLYSLGVILYELLTGVVPFDDPNPTTLALQHVNDPPPPPRVFNPDLSPAVENVLLTALNKSPWDRYPTAHGLIDALEGALQTGVASSQPMTLRVLPARDVPAQADGPAARWVPAPDPRMPDPDATTHVPGVQVWPAGQIPPPAQPVARRSGRRFITCGLLLMAAILLITTAVLAVSRPNGLLLGFLAPTATNPPPAATATITETPTETPTNTPEPSLTPTETVLPSETPDIPATETAGAPTATSTSPPPTITFTLPPTLEPTLTLTLQPTLPPPPVYNILVVGREDESVFIANLGPELFPLAPLKLGEETREITGDDWDVEVIEPGQCVAAWSDGLNPPVPQGLECERVGGTVLRTGNRRFWIRPYDIFYGDQEIGRCENDGEDCIFEFSPQ